MTEQLMTCRETADALKLSLRTVQSMVSTGELRSTLLRPRIRRIYVSSVQQLLEKGETKNAGSTQRNA